MEAFDGFIAAIASEFKFNFKKDSEGVYTTDIEFENGRAQKILITLSKDESGDRIIHYYSVIAKLKRDSMELYKYSLELNSTLDYGAIVLMDGTLVLRNSILLHHCEPQRFMKSLIYIAAKADELEEAFLKQNIS
ncbi:MAG: hypothetical protein JW864_03670 [Spirochaetes bacterium]|nr:hypothetical protein [Spirochaetota bacterium]